MEEIGIVKSIDGVIAKVVVQKKSACDHCEQNTCEVTDGGVETEAINAARATVGQKVKVVMRPQTYLKGALLFYALPVFALIFGALSGKVYLPAYFPGTDPDLLSALGGLLAFLLSLGLVRLLLGRMNRRTEYKSVIEEIIQ